MPEEKKMIEISKSGKINLWTYKETYGFRTIAEALDDIFKRRKNDNQHKKV